MWWARPSDGSCPRRSRRPCRREVALRRACRRTANWWRPALWSLVNSTRFACRVSCACLWVRPEARGSWTRFWRSRTRIGRCGRCGNRWATRLASRRCWRSMLSRWWWILASCSQIGWCVETLNSLILIDINIERKQQRIILIFGDAHLQRANKHLGQTKRDLRARNHLNNRAEGHMTMRLRLSVQLGQQRMRVDLISVQRLHIRLERMQRQRWILLMKVRFALQRTSSSPPLALLAPSSPRLVP